MKLILTFLAMLLPIAALQSRNFYDLEAIKIDGSKFEFQSLRGKKVLIVNTASRCGFTPQYAQLQELHETYAEKGLVILGFPSNNFMGQEPGTNQEIQQFCTRNYGVSFIMMEKINVRKNAKQHPVYQWLTRKDQNNFSDNKVKWNFQKYLIDEKGQLVKVISPRTKPMDSSIVEWIISGS